MITADEALTTAERSAVFVELPRGIFVLGGADARRYLHGRVTQDIKGLETGESAHTLLLTPQGRTLGQLLIGNLGESYLVLSDPLVNSEERSDLLRSLLLFKVADDVQSTDRSEEYCSIAVVGTTSGSIVQSLSGAQFKPVIAPKRGLIAASGRYLIDAPFGDYHGVEIITPRADLEFVRALLQEHNFAEVDFDSYEALRITAGIPRMGAEITEKLIGADLPLERTVAFRKGCYAGQEVIEMATARGRPNRRLITLAAAAPLAVGDEVYLEEGGERRSVGVVTSALFLPQRSEARALAFVKYATPDAARLVVGDIHVTRYASGR